ncbi:TetR/AcrR family transcriptional regulator [Williamsia soli]|uniref:TetR/AcrR family transcriptional regulator n=1 Tax=Williamsia soli TaxID=364929 RepID=UPI001A9CE3E0|nr:TetR/AcrR family transcriptional regulator [Williamsia soli]
MARTANHDERRTQILGGVRAVATSSGIGRVTVARAAEAAGVSVGLVQHYYGSKEDLLIDTFASVRADVLTRIDAEIARAEKRGARVEEMLFDGLGELLPIGARKRDEVYVAHAFAGLALEDAKLRGHLRTANEQLQERVATGLTNGKECGEVDPGLDVDEAAYALVALTDGLAAQLLIHAGAAQRKWALDSIRARAGELCPGECGHRRVNGG